MENVGSDAIVTIEKSDRVTIDSSILERRLKETRGHGFGDTEFRSSVCIYRVPHTLDLIGINTYAIAPEIVSIGPYHRGKDELLEFERYKWMHLDFLISRTISTGVGLLHYKKAMEELESRARECYLESSPMPSADFVEMMLLDGCFVIELFRRVCESDNIATDNFIIFTTPWLIPVILRDVLKLENQIPFFVLKRLFELSTVAGNPGDSLSLLALKVFTLALPRPLEVLKKWSEVEGEHLLHLFHLSFLPFTTRSIQYIKNPLTTSLSNQSIQCVTRLRPSGIKFRPRRVNSFLEINFQKGELEIPPIIINDFTITLLINCVALEQCRQQISTSFSTYLAFMSCLINSARDVTLLSEDGIIMSYSQNDHHVAYLFKKLGENVVFNLRDCYLSKQFAEVEAYYDTYCATLKRTYFSSPWSFISVFSAFLLLVFTGLQTIMAILSYRDQHNHR